MNPRYALAIGASLALAVCLVRPAAAQSELPSQPDPNTPPTRPLTPTRPSAPYKAPKMPGYYPSNAIGVEIGWGAPYGWSLQYARMVTKRLDLNAGAGIGVGGKVGVGARYYTRVDRPLSPYLGLNLAYTGGFSGVDITYTGNAGTEKANYSQAATGLLHLRSGLRWQPGRVGLLASAGYGIRLTGNPIVFNDTDINGQPSQELRDMLDFVGPGGVELSLGVLFGFGR